MFGVGAQDVWGTQRHISLYFRGTYSNNAGHELNKKDPKGQDVRVKLIKLAAEVRVLTVPPTRCLGLTRSRSRFTSPLSLLSVGLFRSRALSSSCCQSNQGSLAAC